MTQSLSGAICAAVQTLDFTMDDNLLLSVMKAQAGSLSKALTEGVMNSADALATAVHITLTAKTFIIEDDGKGFGSEEEIRQWFGRFGTAHTAGDAKFGRFRMGRGQLMAYAENEWRSGHFRMRVDLERKGLRYELQHEAEEHRGCRITGTLYREMPSWELRTVQKELEDAVAFCPIPVFLNGQQIGRPAHKVTDWSFQDKNAYYQLIPDSSELRVFNQGIFVKSYSLWKTGMGGIVVSKQALAVNFARNDILENECEVWRAIQKRLEQRVLKKLQGMKKLSDSERSYLARHLGKMQSLPRWQEVKLLTDPTGRHMPLSKLKSFWRFVLLEGSNPLAAALHGREGTFVVTRAVLDRFGSSTIETWLADLRAIDADLVPSVYEIITPESFKDLGVRGAKILDRAGIPRKALAAYQALSVVNSQLASRLTEQGMISKCRTLLVGQHRGEFQAWTDGYDTITANVRALKLFDQGLDGVYEWVQILVHEYMHTSDDSESHEHGEVFLRKFHDTTIQGARLRLGTLAQLGLIEYLRALRAVKASRPRRLMAQSRGRLDVKSSKRRIPPFESDQSISQSLSPRTDTGNDWPAASATA